MDPSSTRPLEAPTRAEMPSRLASRRRDPRSTACASGVPPGRAFLGYHRRPSLCGLCRFRRSWKVPTQRFKNVDFLTRATRQTCHLSCSYSPSSRHFDEAPSTPDEGTMTAPVVVGSHHDVSAPIRAGHRRVHRASHHRWRAFSEREHGTSASTRILLHPRTTRCHPWRRRRSPTAMAVADGGGSALDLLVSGGVLIALGQAGESPPSRPTPSSPA